MGRLHWVIGKKQKGGERRRGGVMKCMKEREKEEKGEVGFVRGYVGWRNEAWKGLQN
ncbi:hypothetical protein ACLOJK_009341 [Asimina triloba]